MKPKGSKLVQRLRAAIEREEHGRSEQDRVRHQRLEQGRAARDELLEELAGVADQLPGVDVALVDGCLVLRHDGRELRFAPDAQDGLDVSYTGLDASREAQRLYREPQLDDRWVWVRRRRLREDRLPLFDQGLEVLLVHGLGLPEPSEPDLAVNPQMDTNATSEPDDVVDVSPTSASGRSL